MQALVASIRDVKLRRRVDEVEEEFEDGFAFDDSDGRTALYELTLPSFTLGKKLYGNARYDIDGVYRNQTGTDAMGYSYVGKRSQTEWLDENLKEIQTGLDKTLGLGNGRIASWSRDMKRLLVEVGPHTRAEMAATLGRGRAGAEPALRRLRSLIERQLVRYTPAVDQPLDVTGEGARQLRRADQAAYGRWA